MRHTKILKSLIGIQIIFLLSTLVLYRCFGAQLIEMMCHGKLWFLLKSTFKGRPQNPFLFYLIKADELFLTYFLFGVLLIFSQFIILGIVNKSLKHKRGNQALIDTGQIGQKPVGPLTKAVFITIAIALISAFYLLRYKYLLHNLHLYKQVNAPTYKKEIYPELKMKQAVMIGGGHMRRWHPESSYVEYSKYKKTDTIRIGIFGCSFVEGAETAGGHDFPSLLQAKFNKSGVRNVEVINFGLGGRGVYQAYLLWEFLGKDYGLDYVIFYPHREHSRRDSSFCYVFGYNRVYARYIIKDGELKLIPIVGTTPREAIRTYYGIILPWRYIRYDYKMPMFLRVLLPSILHNRSNPFYYKPWKSFRDEIFTTYEMLINRLSEQTNNLIIVANDDEIYALRESLRSSDVYFMKTQAPQILKSFLYLAPKKHNSALGNQICANELFSLLAGHNKPELDIIELSCDLDCQKGDFAFSSFPLYKYADISVNIDQYPVASFVTDITKSHFEGMGDDLEFQKYKIASLLLIPTTNMKTIKFVPLPFLLKHNEQVFLSFKSGNDSIEVPIGVINAPAGVVGKLQLMPNESKPFIKCGQNWALTIRNRGIFFEANAEVSDVCLMAGDKKLLEGVGPYRNAMFSLLSKIILGRTSRRSFVATCPFNNKPVILDFAYLRAKPGQFIDIDALDKKQGSLDLVLTEKDGRQERYPILSYKIRPAKTSDFDPVYPDPISLE